MPPKRIIEKAPKNMPKRNLRSSEDYPRGESKEEEQEENNLREQSDAEASEKADEEEE